MTDSQNSQVLTVLLVMVAVLAWVNFAEHPTARNLKRAIVDSIGI